MAVRALNRCSTLRKHTNIHDRQACESQGYAPLVQIKHLRPTYILKILYEPLGSQIDQLREIKGRQNYN